MRLTLGAMARRRHKDPGAEEEEGKVIERARERESEKERAGERVY